MPSQRHRGPRCRLAILLGLGAVLVAALAGCSPQNIGRYNEVAFGDTRRVRNIINETFDDWYADVGYWTQGDIEPVEDFPGPTAADLRPPEGDYVLGSGDVMQITIQDLFAQGQPWIQTVRVSEEGNVSLPVSYLQDIRAEGYTSRGFERRLVDRLMPPSGPLKNPRVSVFVVETRNRRYAIRGVIRPGIWDIISHDMTLFEAVTQSGDVPDFHEEFMYVVRRMSQEELAELLLVAWAEHETETGNGEQPEVGSGGNGNTDTGDDAAAMPDMSAPVAVGPVPGSSDTPAEVVPLTPGQTAPATPAGDMPSMTDIEELQAVAEGRKPNVVLEGPAPPIMQPMTQPTEVVAPQPPPTVAAATAGGDDWVFDEQKGLWVPAAPSTEMPVTETTLEEGELPELAEDIEKLPPALRERLARLGVIQAGDGLRRIIRISVGALLAGDQTQNIVMRHGDLVNVPQPPAGEWYIDGEIVRRGVYSLTGRKITVLQAVAAAGGLTQLAIPWRTELVRRVGDDREEIIYVDLAKIAKGEAPDFFLQPNDLIRVGTDQGAIFLAVFRNAFRATYGFGLVYDQNFADLYPWTGEVHPLF